MGKKIAGLYRRMKFEVKVADIRIKLIKAPKN